MFFNGYIFDQNGRYSSPVALKGPAEVFDFCQQNKDAHYEIQIVMPEDDGIVVQTISGKYVFPEEWAKQFN